MVGKLDTKNIDKIDVAPDHRIRATVEAQDRKGQGGEQGKREEDEYSVSAGAKEWLKYNVSSADRKTLKLRKTNIARLTLNQVFLQKGIVIIDTNLKLKNGTVLSEAHLYSTKVDVYWKLKNLKKGEDLPIDEMITEPHLEVSVPQKKIPWGIEKKQGQATREKPSPDRPLSEEEGVLWPLFNKETRKVNWKAVTLYAALATAVVILLLTL